MTPFCSLPKKKTTDLVGHFLQHFFRHNQFNTHIHAVRSPRVSFGKGRGHPIRRKISLPSSSLLVHFITLLGFDENLRRQNTFFNYHILNGQISFVFFFSKRLAEQVSSSAKLPISTKGRHWSRKQSKPSVICSSASEEVPQHPR